MAYITIKYLKKLQINHYYFLGLFINAMLLTCCKIFFMALVISFLKEHL